MVVAKWFNAGNHEPLIALVEVVGKGARIDPAHVGGIAVKVGITFGLTTICNVVIVAHWPVFGVKV